MKPKPKSKISREPLVQWIEPIFVSSFSSLSPCPVPKSRKLIITVSSQWMQKRTQEIISKQREIFIYTIQLPSEITSSIEKSEALTQVWTKISSAISKCTKLMHMNLSTQNINSNSFQTYIITWPVSPTKWTLRGAIQRLQIRIRRICGEIQIESKYKMMEDSDILTLGWGCEPIGGGASVLNSSTWPSQGEEFVVLEAS